VSKESLTLFFDLFYGAIDCLIILIEKLGYSCFAKECLCRFFMMGISALQDMLILKYRELKKTPVDIHHG
jgi:hypothetical protein